MFSKASKLRPERLVLRSLIALSIPFEKSTGMRGIKSSPLELRNREEKRLSKIQSIESSGYFFFNAPIMPKALMQSPSAESLNTHIEELYLIMVNILAD